MRLMLFIGVVTFFIGSRVNIFSQTCCSGGVPVSGNIGIFPEANSIFQANLSYDYNLLNTLKDNQSILEESNRIRTTNSLLFESSLNITGRTNIYSFLSYIVQERRIQNSGFTDIQITKGMGDAAFMVGYKLIDKPLIKWLLSAGIKLPIGRSDIKREDGILLNPDLQPGSGAFDGLYLSMLLWNIGKGNTIWHQVAFRNTGTNKKYRVSDSYRFGNEITSSLGWTGSFVISKIILESSFAVFYRYAGKDNINDNIIPSTGGNWVFLSPQISIFPYENLKVFSSAGFPVISHPEGVQLTTTIRFTTGINYFFKQRTKKLKLKI